MADFPSVPCRWPRPGVQEDPDTRTQEAESGQQRGDGQAGGGCGATGVCTACVPQPEFQALCLRHPQAYGPVSLSDPGPTRPGPGWTTVPNAQPDVPRPPAVSPQLHRQQAPRPGIQQAAVPPPCTLLLENSTQEKGDSAGEGPRHRATGCLLAANKCLVVASHSSSLCFYLGVPLPPRNFREPPGLLRRDPAESSELRSPQDAGPLDKTGWPQDLLGLQGESGSPGQPSPGRTFKGCQGAWGTGPGHWLEGLLIHPHSRSPHTLPRVWSEGW